MTREQVIDNWLTIIFKDMPYRRVLLAGDASFRRYFRIFVKNLNTDQELQFILMDAPPPENPFLFSELAVAFRTQGLMVPEIFARQFDSGFLLLSDFGDRLYLKELNSHTAPKLYQDAMTSLIQLQQCQANVKSFNLSFLNDQWNTLFKHWYLTTHLQLNLDRNEEQILSKIFELLVNTIEAQPFVLVHRDYHSRNLMILDEENPGILDFQDALFGPITYDLVSLLQDCYISWPRDRVVQWVYDYKQLAIDSKLLAGNGSDEEFIRWFDFTGIQRHLKNLGIFARLYHSYGKVQYLKDIPRPLGYVMEACNRYEELRGLRPLMEKLMQAEQNKQNLAEKLTTPPNLDITEERPRCAP